MERLHESVSINATAGFRTAGTLPRREGVSDGPARPADVRLGKEAASRIDDIDVAEVDRIERRRLVLMSICG